MTQDSGGSDPEPKQIKPAVKQALELGPPMLFFAVYLWIKDNTYDIGGITYDGFIIAAAGFVPILLISIAVLWWLTGKLSRIQVLTAFMVIVFGGLTVWFNDGDFFKMKTSIVYGIFAAVLSFGLWRGQSYLAWVMDEMMPMAHEGWMILTRRLAMAFGFLAAANEFVWRTMSETTWVVVETFGFPIALFAFLTLQIVGLQKYLDDDDSEGSA
ncbi:MAG: inner membrane-spanning protein YciB [Pseudomonadota bacterium]